MRDPKRIKPFLELVETLWLQHPDLRFFQLLHMIKLQIPPVPFYLEEDAIETGIKGLLK